MSIGVLERLTSHFLVECECGNMETILFHGRRMFFGFLTFFSHHSNSPDKNAPRCMHVGRHTKTIINIFKIENNESETNRIVNIVPDEDEIHYMAMMMVPAVSSEEEHAQGPDSKPFKHQIRWNESTYGKYFLPGHKHALFLLFLHPTLPAMHFLCHIQSKSITLH